MYCDAEAGVVMAILRPRSNVWPVGQYWPTTKDPFHGNSQLAVSAANTLRLLQDAFKSFERQAAQSRRQTESTITAADIAGAEVTLQSLSVQLFETPVQKLDRETRESTVRQLEQTGRRHLYRDPPGERRVYFKAGFPSGRFLHRDICGIATDTLQCYPAQSVKAHVLTRLWP